MDWRVPTLADVLEARRCISPHLRPTPLYNYSALNDLLDAEIWSWPAAGTGPGRAPDADRFLDELEEFLTGAPHAPSTGRRDVALEQSGSLGRLL
jgi:hypothetical protein